MIIHHRGIYPDRFTNPFGIGTLIWAQDCHYNCQGCFHEFRKKTMPVYEEDLDVLIWKIAENPFTQGIELGGYEWTEQYEELLAIITKAREMNLEVILYTHYTIEEISINYSELLDYKGLYIKCGKYDINYLSPTYQSYGIHLASTNQIIYRVDYDI